MAKGYYLVQGDKTTCGGKILQGDPKNTMAGIPVSREQDRVTCGKHSGTYNIIGSIPQNRVNGRKYAGTLHSKSSCPCAAMLIPSHRERTYEA
ncbi:PAAR domain-containing protein [Enterobacteriaceae bacterium DFI.7.85]|nr:PAAR domain-containing protein [Atlantibacter hermannii]MCQ4968991.1 PAAR domain-containing protein [Enterobacteriaceae bacterium DFI.7.85]